MKQMPKNLTGATLDASREYNFKYDRVRSSYKERRVDAWALRAEEGRDKLRKAAGRSKYPMIRRYPNVETQWSKPPLTYNEYIVIRGERGELKHLSTPRKRKKHRFPQ